MYYFKYNQRYFHKPEVLIITIKNKGEEYKKNFVSHFDTYNDYHGRLWSLQNENKIKLVSTMSLPTMLLLMFRLQLKYWLAREVNNAGRINGNDQMDQI